jgi:hypothetical protein
MEVMPNQRCFNLDLCHAVTHHAKLIFLKVKSPQLQAWHELSKQGRIQCIETMAGCGHVARGTHRPS